MKHILILFFSLALISKGFGQTEDEYYKSGNVKFDLEDYRGAIADFTKVIEIDPLQYWAYLKRGISKARLKDYRGAIQDLTLHIDINPENNARAYYARGLCKIEVGQLDSGCLDFSKAGELGYSDAYKAITAACN